MTDDYSGDVSEYAPDGTLDGVFASGLSNPLSLVFDNQGNLYVGQQTTPYIAEFFQTGQFVQNIGPLATELTGDDWIALAPDECTFYYTTEGTDILRYNMCTNQQLPNLNVDVVPLNRPHRRASAVDRPSSSRSSPTATRSWPTRTPTSCWTPMATSSRPTPVPRCRTARARLFAISLDPDGNSFWTGDSNSGYVWQVDIASGDVLQTINTRSGALYGLSVDDQIEVATPPRPPDDHGAVEPRRPAGQRQLLVAHAGLGGADQPEHGHAHRQRARDLHAQRLRDMYRRHRLHRHGHL